MAEYLQLAQTREEEFVIGWMASDKKDGVRCFWDGGISTGLPASDVPYSTEKRDCIATGLWTRYGKVVNASAYFVADLPNYFMDGELFIEGQTLQDIISVVKRHVPDIRWQYVNYQVFDWPTFREFAHVRDILNNVIDFTMPKEAKEWIEKRAAELAVEDNSFVGFKQRYLERSPHVGSRWAPIEQHDIQSMKEVEAMMEVAYEGVMVRNPFSYYECRRSPKILKIKHEYDEEATVVGYVEGKGKYENMLGSLVCEQDGIKFRVSGVSDDQREVDKHGAAKAFPVGTIITFRYQAKTKAGKPRHARYKSIWNKV